MILLPLSKSVADAWALLMTEDKYLAIDSDHVAGLVSTMAIIGLTAMRDFPPAFPSDMDCRAAMFNGLSAEITESVNIDRSVVGLFLSRAYDAVLGGAGLALQRVDLVPVVGCWLCSHVSPGACFPASPYSVWTCFPS